RDVAAAGRAGVLNDRHRVQLRYTRRQLSTFRWRRRGILVFALSPRRVVERPVLHLALSALHDDAADLVVTAAIRAEVAGGEVEVFFRNRELLINAVEAKLHVGFRERKRVGYRDGFALFDPFVHAPEMRIVQLEADAVHDSCDQRKLFRRTDRTADAGRVVRRRLPPGFDVFEGLGEVE